MHISLSVQSGNFKYYACIAEVSFWHWKNVESEITFATQFRTTRRILCAASQHLFDAVTTA